MWILNPLETEGGKHYLLPGKEYVVGRKNCQVLLPSDQSISRVHAHLTVTDQALIVKDSSKYGTFVNEERLPGDTPHTLNTGDRLTFGMFHSKFSVQRDAVVVCSSCVDNDGKASLSQALQLLGGQLVNNWTQSCTHLVMPTVKITIKTICALLCCRPIVKQEFFTELGRALQQNQHLPKAESFLPEIDEPSLNKEEVDLTEKPERKRLFSGKIFLFLSAKQLKRLSLAVSCGGGRSQLLEEASLQSTQLESPSCCVIELTGAQPSTTKNWADSVGRILQRKGLRFIKESEIGLAAIFVSCDKYCNPASLVVDSESMRTKTTIHSATLSQNAPVNETVLPTSSQNITAYAFNTEPSQGISGRDMVDVSAVRETPQKDLRRTTPLNQPPKPSFTNERAETCTVAETMMSSFSATDCAGGGGGSERKKAEKQHSGSRQGEQIPKLRAPSLRPAGGVKTTSSQKSSPHKQIPQTDSSQKQSTLINFFQPVGKKRQREGEQSTTVQSEAKLSRREVEDKTKRTAPSHVEPSNIAQNRSPSNQITHSSSTTTHSCSGSQIPTCGFQSQQGSGADLFSGRTSALTGGVQSRKRKEMEENTKGERVLEMEMDELEAIMSEDMDELDTSMSESHDQRTRLTEHSSTNKRQRVDLLEPSTANHKPSLDPEAGSSANKRPQAKPVAEFKEEEVSFDEAKPANGVALASPEELTTDPKPSEPYRQEALVSEDKTLPSRLLVVEFKSLTMANLARAKTHPTNGNVNRKDFKRFRKVPVPGLLGLPKIIGGSYLLAHNRAKNSELEEWLRDAAEDERQSKKEDSVADDLFRYNPKPTKKR
ncbi:hypothetical protein DPEC_G00141860 [Dallia pectoralis]|uniref:Uncharacterized protein n=1 Tax=Dallia pectoralis TaxID=75939 RepID=A0ACC2GMZ1_DALPE|nr:hypothetical protein DPEC_G00141860 [Dallia pectoralis]